MGETESLIFRVPFEHRPVTVGELLRRGWPEASEEEREEALDAGRVKLEERPVYDAESEPNPAAVIRVETSLEGVEYGMPDAEELARGADWIVVDKPVGMPGTADPDDPMHPIFFLADSLGLDRSTFTPAWRMPTMAGGPWLFGTTPEAAERLRRLWREGELMTTWVAISPRPELAQGTIYTPDAYRIQYSATTMREGLCEMQLTPAWDGDDPPDEVDLSEVILTALAEEGTPVLGDRRRGGFLTSGGLRLRLAALFHADSDLQQSWPPPDDWWPADPVIEPEPEGAEELQETPESVAELDLPDLVVTASTLERLRKEHHPWVTTGDVAGRHGQVQPGKMIRIKGANNVYGPLAIAEDFGDIVARIWSWDPLDAIYREETVDIRVDEALARRADLLRGVSELDLFRLIHGEADGLPGIYVDRVGPVLRAELRGAAALPYRHLVYDLLVEFDPKAMILEVERPEVEAPTAADTTRIAREGASYIRAGRDVVVREGGTRFRCDPWAGRLPVDPAHRTTRQRLAEEAEPGSHWLVAASPTTAAPVVLAVHGAAEVLHIGEETPAARMQESVVLNGYDSDALKRLRTEPALDRIAEDEKAFDGIVIDLALADDHHELDESSLAEATLQALGPGGTAFVVGRPLQFGEPLESLVRKASDAASVDLADVSVFGPPSDFPHLDGFPEGDPFVGVCVRT